MKVMKIICRILGVLFIVFALLMLLIAEYGAAAFGVVAGLFIMFAAPAAWGTQDRRDAEAARRVAEARERREIEERLVAEPIEYDEEDEEYAEGLAPSPVFKTKGQIVRERKAAAAAQGIACCPKCGSTSLTANKKGYGIGKAVVGAAVAGPLGLAAGNVGQQKVLVTCLNCGHRFKPGKK